MPFVQRRKPSQESVRSPPSVHPLRCLVALTSTTQCLGHNSSLQFVFPIKWGAHPRRNRSVSFGSVSSSSRKSLLFKHVLFPDVSCNFNPTLPVEAEEGLEHFLSPLDIASLVWMCQNGPVQMEKSLVISRVLCPSLSHHVPTSFLLLSLP